MVALQAKVLKKDARGKGKNASGLWLKKKDHRRAQTIKSPASEQAID